MAKNKCGKLILQAIRQIKRNKKRPSPDKICHAVRKADHDISEEVVLEQLELSVRKGKIQRTNRKGIESYTARCHRKEGKDGAKLKTVTNEVKVAEVSVLELLNVSTILVCGL